MPIDDFTELWVVEYSHSQGALNTQKPGEAVQDKLLAFLESRPGDYSIVAVATTQQRARLLCEVLDARPNRRVPFDEAEAHRVAERLKEVYRLPDADRLDQEEPDDDD